jgi:hypothetical protein
MTSPTLRQVVDANQRYYQDLANPVARTTKVSSLNDQVSGFLKEASVFNTIIPPKPISPENCEVDETYDTLRYRIHDVPRTSVGMGSMDAMAGQVREPYLARIFGSFLMLQTPRYQFNEYRMMAYRFPVAEQVKSQIGIDFQEARDWVIHGTLDEMLQAYRGVYNNVFKGENVTAAGNSGDGTRVPIARNDFSRLKQYYANKRARLARVLIPEQNFLQIEQFKLEDNGDQLMGEVTVEGYTKSKLLGVEMIRTIKTDSLHGDVFRADNIYGFADADNLGRQYDFQGIRHDVEVEAQFLRMSARMVFSYLWFSPAYVSKIELYQAGLDVDGETVLSGTVSQKGNTYGVSDRLFSDSESFMERDFLNIREGHNRPRIVIGA